MAARAPVVRDQPDQLPVAEEPLPSVADGRPPRSRVVAQALLVALAALLLFGAGYVVAARDRLAEEYYAALSKLAALPTPEGPAAGACGGAATGELMDDIGGIGETSE